MMHRKGVKNMEYMIKTTEAAFKVTVAGEEFVVDFARMHPTWIAAHLKKAAQRFVNDGLTGMSGELPSVKAAMARDMFGKIHSGEAMPAKERKAAAIAKPDMARKIARDLATTELLATFKSMAKQLGADEKAWAKHPAVAKYFKVSDKGRVTFDLGEVDQYIMRAVTREKNPTDFLAQAQAQIDAAESIADDVDLSDMGI
jgi:hypothetical protein